MSSLGIIWHYFVDPLNFLHLQNFMRWFYWKVKFWILIKGPIINLSKSQIIWNFWVWYHRKDKISFFHRILVIFFQKNSRVRSIPYPFFFTLLEAAHSLYSQEMKMFECYPIHKSFLNRQEKKFFFHSYLGKYREMKYVYSILLW